MSIEQNITEIYPVAEAVAIQVSSVIENEDEIKEEDLLNSFSYSLPQKSRDELKKDLQKRIEEEYADENTQAQMRVALNNNETFKELLNKLPTQEDKDQLYLLMIEGAKNMQIYASNETVDHHENYANNDGLEDEFKEKQQEYLQKIKERIDVVAEEHI